MHPASARRVVLAAALGGCRADGAPAHPTLALVTIDTWRADHFGPELTPNLWALAQEGTRYANAWSPIGLTSAAHATMLSGLMPWEHGMEANNHHGYAVRDEVALLPERHAGWARGAFVSAWPAGPEGGLGRGWEVFDGPDSGERPGEVAVERALAWLPQDRPALLWVHLFEPHGPYQGSAPTDRERYAQEVRRADAILEPLLDRLVRRRATIVVAGDHGEVLDEETCGWQHERSSSDHVLRVPLFRWSPAERAHVSGDLVGLDAVPDLLAGEAPEPRTVWLAESGMCEPGCTPGCAPPGLAGRDRVAVTATGRWISRPGRGRWATGAPSDEAAALLDTIPALAPPSVAVDPEALESLGYR